MSVQGLSKLEVTGPLPKKTKETWIVGNQQISSILKKVLQETSIHIETDSKASEDSHNLIFCKDWMLQRPDGSLLLPFPIKDPLLEYRFHSLLPPSSKHFLSSREVGYGTSFSPEMHEAALNLSKDRGFQTRQGTTCVESGNCFYLSSQHAVIGCHSVALSLIALEEQEAFDFSRISIEEPSILPEDFIRLARNYQRHEQIAQRVKKANPSTVDEACSAFNSIVKEEFGGMTQYKTSLISTKDLDPKTKQALIPKAIELFKKFKITQDVIAKELQVSEVTSVLQYKFHIDMEICISPDRTILLHDEKKGLELLNTLYRGANPRLRVIFDKYIGNAKSREEQRSQIVDEIEKEFTQNNLSVHRVFGAFESSGEDTINFMNGLFYYQDDNSIFLTNGVKQRYNMIQDEFQSIFTSLFPKTKIHFIDGDIMQEVLTKHYGGISCLTGIYKS